MKVKSKKVRDALTHLISNSISNSFPSPHFLLSSLPSPSSPILNYKYSIKFQFQFQTNFFPLSMVINVCRRMNTRPSLKRRLKAPGEVYLELLSECEDLPGQHVLLSAQLVPHGPFSLDLVMGLGLLQVKPACDNIPSSDNGLRKHYGNVHVACRQSGQSRDSSTAPAEVLENYIIAHVVNRLSNYQSIKAVKDATARNKKKKHNC